MTDSLYLTLAEATAYFPKKHGKKVHVRTLKRRITRGCHGVQLRAIKDGHFWLTTPEWIQEFQVACTRQALPAPLGRHPRQRKIEHKIAKDYLARRFGIHGDQKTVSG